MGVPFTGIARWEWKKIACVSLIAGLILLAVWVVCSKPREPTLEDRVKALEVLLYTDDAIHRHEKNLYDLQEWAEEIDTQTAFDDKDLYWQLKRIENLEEWLAEVQRACDRCLHECGGPD